MILPATILTVLAESAARSLLLATAVGAGLLLLRTRNVPARKAAWMLVLAASFAMPLLARWAASASWIPPNAAFLISGAAWRSSSPLPAAAAPVLAPADSLATVPAPHFAARESVAPAAGTSHFPAPVITHISADAPAPAATASRHFSLDRGSALLLLYLAVCGVFLLRVAYGLWTAAYLWSTAKPVDVGGNPSGLRLRSSERIASPVTLGSGIVLPTSWRGWDREKLRIVLAHEASHVRQGDFYLQLATSLYAAIFWFSPLGWWLKRILADLAETISDRAAVEHAASHASYAQVLLEFAALPRPIPTGVAMAHHGRIVPRIERLLNESSFRQSFAGGRGRIAAAILLVIAAAFASTALVRVQAAGQQAPPATEQSVAPPAAPQSPAEIAPPPPATAPASPAATPDPALAAPDVDEGQSLPGAEAPVAPRKHLGAPIVVGPQGSYFFTVPNAKILAGNARMMAMMQADKARLGALNGKNFFRFGFGNDGNTYAYVTGEGEKNIHFSGNWYEGSRSAIDKARTVAHGDFLWFERDGKSYVIDDQALLASLKPMQDKMDALGQQQEGLGKQQEELGRQQEDLGKQMQQLKVPTPDMKKELEKLKAVEEKLAAIQGKNASQEELANLQGQLAEVQGQIGDLQGNMGGQMGELGSKMGELGSQQGKLGSQQGRLGAEQGRIAREMDGKILSIIDASLKDGKARPVQ